MKFLIAVILLLPIFTTAQRKIDVERAIEHVSENVTICDSIYNAIYLQSSFSKPTLLNMGGTYPNHKFTIVIANHDRKSYREKPEEYYLKKVVCVTGRIELYDGKPQVFVTSPSDITVMTKQKEKEQTFAKEIVVRRDSTSSSSTNIKLSTSKNLREGPGTSFPVIQQLESGSIVTVLKSRNNWSFVSVQKYLAEQKRTVVIKGFLNNTPSTNR